MKRQSKRWVRRSCKKSKAALLAFVLLAGASFASQYQSQIQTQLEKWGNTYVSDSLDAEQIPTYEGETYVVLNDNVPAFTQEELAVSELESYSDLDSLGRCGVAVARIGEETMPTEERGKIGMIKPSGWQTVKYEGLVEGNYLYNRCHLIGFQLAGENANEKNLITGTRYFNTEGMLPFENQVAEYVHSTGHHVLYRVTPVFEGDELVARGVKMEAQSIEDQEIQFCVFVFNVQPGITIDYATGDSKQTK